MKKYIFFLCIFSVLMTACYDNTEVISEPEVILSPVEVLIDTKILGYVYNDEGRVSDFELIANEDAFDIETDDFEIELKNVKQKGQTFHIKKDGQRIGIRTQLLVENDRNKVTIRRHKGIESTTIAQNSSMMINNELELNFEYVAWKSGYEGDVKVEFTPISKEVELTTVGYTNNLDVYAVDGSGGFYLAVYDLQGERLSPNDNNLINLEIGNLAEGMNAIFEFDSERELWILIEEITTNSSVEVRGSGYYAFGKIEKGVFVDGLVQKDGIGLAFQKMNSKIEDWNQEFYTTEVGRWISVLPENNSNEIALNNPCDEETYSTDIIIDANDESGVVIDVDTDAGLILLDAAVVDCDQEEISAPQVLLSNGEITESIIFDNSTPNVWISTCEDMTIAVGDDSGSYGPSYDVSSSILDESTSLSACDGLEAGYINIMIKDDKANYESYEIETIDGRSYIQSSDKTFKLILPEVAARTYSSEEVNIYINDEDFGNRGYFIECEYSSFGCGLMDLKITEDDTWYSISFEGKLWMQTINPPIAGNFPISGNILIQK